MVIHTSIVAIAATRLSSDLLPGWQVMEPVLGVTVALMVTKIGRHQAAHLYIKEWLDHRGISDEVAAGRLGIDRTTVWKWHAYPNRLTPDKIASLAIICQIEPEEFYRPPDRPSLDAMVKNEPVEVQDMVADVVRRMVGRR